MTIVYIIAAILIFGVLIAVHELGHFLAAKLCGVRVNEFSIGMGPLIWEREKGETQYSLRALPIGGFCAMEGEDEDTGDRRSFVRQGFWKKFFILAAGSLMNFLTGVLILLALYAGATFLYADQVTGLAPEFAQTGENGLMEGDLLYKVNGYRTFLRGDTKLFLQYAGESVDIEVVRDGRHIRLTDVPRQICTSTDGKTTYSGFGLYVGVAAKEATLSGKLQYTWNSAMDFVQLVWFSLGQLITGNAGMQDLSGPVGIVSTMTEVGNEAESAVDAWSQIFYFAALLAVNLSVMNLLPIPALDGGRIFFLLVDAISMALFHKTVPERYQSAVNTAGFVLLMGFMLLVTFHDVFRLIQ
ncbi:site-2 protease family protein [Oscillibacter sp.]|uniref:M50 family metallopeptidase n=1 Tax=Oscillibacter sp. TaxID=1945593 RepID=UPI00260B8A95|nr:site-2 protease family protein [Oscillibacter sp.]MDD3346513.1 site-2 protease family protein [Oscillibacter sp.]